MHSSSPFRTGAGKWEEVHPLANDTYFVLGEDGGGDGAHLSSRACEEKRNRSSGEFKVLIPSTDNLLKY